MENYEIDGYQITIMYDAESESPREWDNLGTMVCKCRSYDLGDKEASKRIPWDNFTSMAQVKKYLCKKHDVAIILPIYMYSHSGITINTKPYSCQLDSGQIGFIFIEKDKIKTEYSVDQISAELLDQVTSILNNEVQTYASYLEGTVYGYIIKDSKGHEVDRGWGVYGYDQVKKECSDIVKALPHNNAEDFILS